MKGSLKNIFMKTNKKGKELKILLAIILSGFVTNLVAIKLLNYIDYINNSKLDINNNLVEIILFTLFLISVMLLLLLPFFIMTAQRDKKKKTQYFILGISVVGFITLYAYSFKYVKIRLIFILFLYFTIIYFVYILLKVIEISFNKIYSWLWETSYIKGNKVKRKYRRLDTKKLSLLWAIIIFILGLLFNFNR